MDMHHVYWTAGFLDGDGSFSLCGQSPRVSATQADLFPLEKLVRLWGGAISPKKLSALSRKPLFAWACGSNTVGLMMTLYPLMSPSRQQQIAHALMHWKSTGAAHGARHYNAVLTDDEALTVMRRVQAGESTLSLEREVGVSHTTISFWMRGLKRPYLFKRLAGDNAVPKDRGHGQDHYLSTINDDDALNAMRRVLAGASMYRVARELQINDGTLSAWMRGTARPSLLAQLREERHGSQKGEINGFDF